MKRPTWILISMLLVGAALPSLAHAGPLDAFRKAKLQSATGTLTMTETRCAPGASDCGKARLDEKFVSARSPKQRADSGLPGFTTGRRIAGNGTGMCNAESPTTIITGPDGSVQFLEGAARVDPGSFDATRIALAAGKRGVRVVWREPLAPAIVCNYFDEPGTEVALPAAVQLPPSLISPTIGPRVFKRARFTITIAGAQDWTETAADGTQVTGRASWKLQLAYKR